MPTSGERLASLETAVNIIKDDVSDIKVKMDSVLDKLACQRGRRELKMSIGLFISGIAGGVTVWLIGFIINRIV